MTKAWFTVRELALLLHVSSRTVRRLIEPHRERCHLAREGRHPRLVLWVPAAVVADLRRERREMWRGRFRDVQLRETPVKPHPPWPLT